MGHDMGAYPGCQWDGKRDEMTIGLGLGLGLGLCCQLGSTLW